MNTQQQIFAEYAKSMNPDTISLTTGEEKTIMTTTDTHCVEVTDNVSGRIIVVTGNYNAVKKYLKGIEGKHKHGRQMTVNKFIGTIYS